MPPKKNTKNTTTTTRKKPTAKRTRNTTNANTAHPRPQPPRPSQVLRNMITLNAIPNGRVFMLGKEGSVKQPYDVHGLANMVHHNTRGRLTNLGRPAPREPHTREELSQRTINAIMKHAKNTGWVRPSAESTMTVTANNRRVPANLAATAAVERAARNATLGRQRAASRQANISSLDEPSLRHVVVGMQRFEQWYRDVARDVGSLFRFRFRGAPGRGQLGAEDVQAAEHFVQTAARRLEGRLIQRVYSPTIIQQPYNPKELHIQCKFGRGLSLVPMLVPINRDPQPANEFPIITFVSRVTRSGLFLVRIEVCDHWHVPRVGSIYAEGDMLSINHPRPNRGTSGARFNWKDLDDGWTSRVHENGAHINRRQLDQHVLVLNQALRALGVRRFH